MKAIKSLFGLFGAIILTLTKMWSIVDLEVDNWKREAELAAEEEMKKSEAS